MKKTIAIILLIIGLLITIFCTYAVIALSIEIYHELTGLEQVLSILLIPMLLLFGVGLLVGIIMFTASLIYLIRSRKLALKDENGSTLI